MKTHKQSFKFKKGQKLHLDDIYDIQGLSPVNWWEHINMNIDDNIVITRDIEIIVTTKFKD